MEIVFRNAKLAKQCSSAKDCDRQYGDQLGKKIRQRLADLSAAETLGDVSKLPPARCHALSADREGQFAVDLKQPYRLIFEPADEPVPGKPDGSVDQGRVTRIRIVEITDYHGR
ncbi:MAG: killer suppression protein [Planctomycetes bacterium]|nr:killer suppression protein [Planctomycetota bacterium]